MGTLQVQNINLAFGDRDLLKDVSFTLSDNARAALTGGNGSGKSTLLRIISGQVGSDHGTTAMGRNMRVSYLPQSDIVHEANTVYVEVEKGYHRFKTYLERQREIEAKLSTCTEDRDSIPYLEELHDLQEFLLHSSYYRRQAVIEQILKGLGFTREDTLRQCDEFSGGWQMRIALAKVLVEDPDVMLLDEPTNYLDIEARIWLRNYLRQYRGAVMIVSHDQDFLDDTVNEVYELFNGKLTRYSGNYSSYQIQREQELAQMEKAFKNQRKELEKTEQFIERFRYKASKARQVQSREKQLEKVDIIQIPQHLRKLSFSFPLPPHCGNDIVTVDDLSKSYGSLQIFKDLSLMVNRGDRLAVTGRNGAGKSTLLRMLAQIDSEYSGTISLGSGVQVGYFAQDTEHTLNYGNTILEEVETISDTSDIPRLRSLLGSFLFSDDDVDKKVSVLSGGERSRLALLKILLHPANLLILDEPTNHLDINAKQMLLQALRQYKGTVVFVSHDTHFIKNIANRILYLSEDAPEFFEGDYDYFSWKLEQKEAIEQLSSDDRTAGETVKSQAKETASLSWKETNRMKNRLRNMHVEAEELLGAIADKERDKNKILEDMSLEKNYSDSESITKLLRQKETLEVEHGHMEEQWLMLHQQIDEMEALLGIHDSGH
ncbi:MAG: ABC-F family ATP-binding cassette domain-containing protein [Sphaerochaeta sp.]|jgi:ATP-binding cassette subfamily F protein 3|nr:ABC-F family ATP-binding cassette domain-containing protein [Sphaerochaeta sp.]PKL29629.1 MAG: ABC transporter ATP-binding protein [Spirochaetae bacterium HGW-Spirochaetae-2]